MGTNKAVGIWIRVSTEFQVKDDSPEHHETRARLYAEAKGWEVKEVYRLDAISGKTVMEQPETKRMLKDIRNGHITGLVFSKLARLARNTRELLEFAEIFREQNADLVSLGESIDTSSPAGKLFYTIFSALAEWERSEIAARVAASVPIRAKLNKPLGGQAPFGYKWEGKAFGIDEKEAPIRKMMYELFIEHKRKGTVADILNKKGFRTRNGSKFSDTTIGRLLVDPMAKGLRRANYTKSLGEGKQWVYKPQEEWVIMECPAIVSEEVWNDCNNLIVEQTKPKKKPAKKPVHLFTNILFCGCGAKMLVPSKSKKYVCSGCKQARIDASDLEEIYYEYLQSFLLTEAQLSNYLSKTDEKINSNLEQLQSLTEESKKIKEQMEKLVDLHLSGEIPKDGFGNRYNPLDERAKQIDKSLPEIQAQIDFLKIEHLNSDFLVSEAKSLAERWPELTPDAKRNIVEQITDFIRIDGEDIDIQFNYTPSLSGIDPDSQHNRKGSY